jgi:predicted nucleotidyltransferase
VLESLLQRYAPVSRAGDALKPCVAPDGQGPAMNRDQILELLAHCKPTLVRRFGVTDLALFGSIARGTARQDSDVDILVSFDGPATSDRYFGVQFFLEDLLNRPVDLVTDKALRPELRPFVENEAVRV